MLLINSALNWEVPAHTRKSSKDFGHTLRSRWCSWAKNIILLYSQAQRNYRLWWHDSLCWLVRISCSCFCFVLILFTSNTKLHTHKTRGLWLRLWLHIDGYPSSYLWWEILPHSLSKIVALLIGPFYSLQHTTTCYTRRFPTGLGLIVWVFWRVLVEKALWEIRLNMLFKPLGSLNSGLGWAMSEWQKVFWPTHHKRGFGDTFEDEWNRKSTMYNRVSSTCILVLDLSARYII